MQRRRRLHPYRPPTRPNEPHRTQTPTDSQEETSNDSGFRAVDLEQLTKALGFLAILFYVVGLLAINGYLFSIGVSDFSLARPRFVYTGALLVVTGVICYFMPALSIVTIRRRQLQRKLQSKRATKGQVSSGIIVVLLTLLLPLAILHASFSLLPSTDDFDALSLALVIYGTVLLAGVSIHIVWNQANSTLLKVKSTERQVSRAAAGQQIHSASQAPFSALRISYVFFTINLAIVVIITLSAYTRIFMQFAFPVIPGTVWWWKTEDGPTYHERRWP
jgi:hypothetical protein